MALISPITLAVSGLATVTAAWTGTGYSFRDGVFNGGPDVDGAEVYAQPDSVFALEVHDEEVARTVHREPELHPLIRWTPVATAERYYVYHTQPGGSEARIHTAFHDDDVGIYSVRCPVECEAGWNKFRVEAVLANGIESTTAVWYERIRDLPEAPSDMTLAGTGGVFTLTLTA